jgi:hypothetical protein
MFQTGTSSALSSSLIHHDDRHRAHFGRPSPEEQSTMWLRIPEHQIQQYFYDSAAFDSEADQLFAVSHLYPVTDVKGRVFIILLQPYPEPSWDNAACTVEQAMALAGHANASIAPLDTQLDASRFHEPAGASPITDGSSDTQSVASPEPSATYPSAPAPSSAPIYIASTADHAQYGYSCYTWPLPEQNSQIGSLVSGPVSIHCFSLTPF